MNREEKVFQQFYRPLCHFSWKIVGDSTIAEDVVQDAFIDFFKVPARLDGEEVRIKGFLYTAVRFASLNYLRREKIKQKYWSMTSFTEEDGESMEMHFTHSQVLAEIYRIMETMPFSCQQIFRMGYLEGLSNMEIVAQLKISVNTVKTQKQRGLKFLMQRLDPEFIPLIIFLLK
ncbi:RNA polymerase sigma-70 factor [Sphingobacterium sp. Mn56C]|uniref:RNA polymerase sigma-70 factor n=1 Tax=Sphingobacterium sp. Mn56C TaxID=3395261 RepID=UPI003BEAB574